MKTRICLISILFFSNLLLTGCSDNSSDGSSTKNVTGIVDTALTSAAIITSKAVNTSGANEIWVAALSRTEPYDGGVMVTMNYGALVDDVQKFPVEADGKFNLKIQDICPDIEGQTDCLGYVLMLVNTNATALEEKIISFLSLDGTNSLVALPLKDLGNSGLDFETVTAKGYDESAGIGIDKAAERFSTLSVQDLETIAAGDDYVKLAKNFLVNPGTSLESSFYFTLNGLVNDTFTNLANVTYEGASISIQFNSYNETFEALNIIDDGSKTYSLTPPSTITLTDASTSTDHTQLTFSSTLYDSKLAFTSGEIQIGRGLDSHITSSMPEGAWIFKNETDNQVIGAFDFTIGNPVDVNQKLTKQYIPSVMPVTDSNGKVYKLLIEWYTHNGTDYVKVTDFTQFKKTMSQLTFYVYSDIGNANYDLLGKENVSEIILNEPITMTQLNIEYRYYTGHINIQFNY